MLGLVILYFHVPTQFWPLSAVIENLLFSVFCDSYKKQLFSVVLNIRISFLELKHWLKLVSSLLSHRVLLGLPTSPGLSLSGNLQLQSCCVRLPWLWRVASTPCPITGILHILKGTSSLVCPALRWSQKVGIIPVV